MHPTIEAVPVLSDNYAWLIHDGREAVVVDPGEAGPVLAALEQRRLRLRWLLATHHHHDHVGGIEALCAAASGVEVVSSMHDLGRVPRATRGVVDGERLTVAGLELTAMLVPGHTLGALTYVGGGAMFTGDTLFLAGCGRLFEGTPEQMFTSLRRLAALPPETLVYCGHEYTEKNLRFAASVEPDNPAIAERQARVVEQRRQDDPTVPAPLAVELATNPFLRAKDLVEFTTRRSRRDAF
jgi:hydroxyacylglutathione hydrolase